MKNSNSPIDYVKLFQSLPTAFIVFRADDPIFTIIEENEAHAIMANVSRSDCIGRPLLEVFPDVSDAYVKTGKSELLDSIRRVVKIQKPDAIADFHYDIKDRHGAMQQRYWNVTHYPVLENEKVIAVYQATKDITAETLAAQQSKTTQYQLKQILKAGNIGTWIWNIDDETIKGDKNTAMLFGLDADAVEVGVTADEYTASIHPEDRARVNKEFHNAIARLEPYECEYRTLDANGDVHWVIARGYFDKSTSSNSSQSPGILIDITERKRAEENLNFLTSATAQFSASLGYKEILHSITEMVVPRTADWCSIEILENGRLEQVALAHKDPQKVKWAKELRKKQGPPDPDMPTGVAKVMRTGEAEYYPYITKSMLEASATSKKELKLLLELGFSSVIIAPLTLDGKTIGALTFVATESRLHYTPADLEVAKALANRAALAVYNATLYGDAKRELKERRLLQADLQKLNEELESRVIERTKELGRSNQELQDFAYVASHDLQEPLRKIQAFGDLLENEYSDTLGQSGQEYLERMRSAAARMSTLIQDLLAFSRVTTKAKPNELVDLNTIAKDVVSDLEERIHTTDGVINISQLPSVYADTTHMLQLFQNLIGNALKFHREGIPPRINVYSKPVQANDIMHTIYFEDNGIGFEEKYLDRIFSVFQRLHGKEEYEGTGIGLAVCRKIAERYNGTITAKSTINKGSVFSFSIPIAGKDSSNE